MKRAILTGLTALSLGLAASAHAGTPVSADFTYDTTRSAEANLADMTQVAMKACKQSANHSYSFVERFSRDQKEACAADLVASAIDAFEQPALTRAFQRELTPVQLAKADQ